jgi:hypothetical protein
MRLDTLTHPQGDSSTAGDMNKSEMNHREWALVAPTACVFSVGFELNSDLCALDAQVPHVRSSAFSDSDDARIRLRYNQSAKTNSILIPLHPQHSMPSMKIPPNPPVDAVK